MQILASPSDDSFDLAAAWFTNARAAKGAMNHSKETSQMTAIRYPMWGISSRPRRLSDKTATIKPPDVRTLVVVR